jgi:ABC-2 type transport system ATP-binding protein
MTTITVDHLTKRYGATTAVDDLSFTVPAGSVTGFLGRNGAGKTTTLRVLLGLARPTAGTATFDGVPYGRLPDPARTVGAMLEADPFHPGRSGRDHLRVLATAAGIPPGRVDEVLDLVGLAGAARRAAGGYSLGMRRRLGLAAALLGDPRVLVLTSPPTASTRRASAGCGTCWPPTPPAAAACWSPATCSRRWRCWPSGWW